MELVERMTIVIAEPQRVVDRSKRRPWTEADNRRLMGYWDIVGSVALIAIILQRSPSSVQTQASRLGLPPRAEEKDRHRRRWADGDDEALDQARRPHWFRWQIPTVDVARVIQRSGCGCGSPRDPLWQRCRDPVQARCAASADRALRPPCPILPGIRAQYPQAGNKKCLLPKGILLGGSP